ncbi:MAG TPA: hypothetical protein VK157_01620 [Phycisphaerales bacterium]|nr:hypothetical protein [Phycisphaerales bacterium]
MIVTSDKPWRRHFRRGWWLLGGAVLLAAIIVAAEWLWWFGGSLFVSVPTLPGKVVAIERAAETSWSFALGPDPQSLDVRLDRGVTAARWRSTRNLDANLLRRASILSSDDGYILFSRAALYLDPPLTLAPAVGPDWTKAVGFHARLEDGSSVWVYEIGRPFHNFKPLYNVDDYEQHGLFRSDLLIFDESRSSVLARATWYDNLATGTARFVIFKFLAVAAVLLVLVAVPAARVFRHGFITRRRFLARRCIACDYNFAGHGDGLLTCPECGQVQWPVDRVVSAART